MARLPTPGADDGAWGDILNEFLSVEHNTDGTQKPLDITNTDVNVSAAIARSKLDFGSGLVNADVAAAAAIVYSKLALTGGIVNADVNASAAIAYSKLALGSSIVNADVAAAAAIALSKLADPGAGNVLTSTGAGAIAAKPPGYEFGYIERTTSFTTTQTVQASAGTFLTLPTISFDGSTIVIIEFYAASMEHNGGGFTQMNVDVWEDSTDLGRIAKVTSTTASHPQCPGLCAIRRTPSSGDKVYTARGWVTGAGTGTVTATATIPTWMRIIKG